MYDASQSVANVGGNQLTFDMKTGYETLTVYSAVAGVLTGPANSVGWTIAAGSAFTVNVKGIAAGEDVFSLDGTSLGRVEITFEYGTGTAGV